MIKLENIYKTYKNKNNKQEVLKNLSINFREKEFVSILGASGSGKTTLLNIIGGLDRDYAGSYKLGNNDLTKQKDKFYDFYRNKMIGFVFQDYNLIEHLTVYKNIEIALYLGNSKNKKQKIFEILDSVGLLEYSNTKVSKLSGGQKQRVAIARALINDCKILLMDEPTGALDTKLSDEIMKLIKKLTKDKLVIMVTHNENITQKYSDRIIKIKDGEITCDSNPYKESTKEELDLKLQKSGFTYCQLIKMSLNNLKVKFWRNLLTTLAFTISIIGICLVISIAEGFNYQVEVLKNETLGNYPIVISSKVQEISKENNYKNNKIYAHSAEKENSKNNITKDYINHLEKLNNKDVLGTTYNYEYNFPVITNYNNTINFYNDLPFITMPDNNDYLKKNYKILKGNLPKNNKEIVLKVDDYNRINKDILKALGINKEIVAPSSLIGKKIKIILNDTLYQKQNKKYSYKEINKKLETNPNNITLKITGIIKSKQITEFNSMINDDTGAIYYKNSLIKEVLEKNNASNVVNFQKKVNYDVFTGKKVNYTEKENILKSLGGYNKPYMIYIYPTNYEGKNNIKNHLDLYNKNNEKIKYIDMADDVVKMTKSLIFGITTILFIFSGISLVIALILITIITYTSSLERKKEIGIIRSLGGRKKDVKHLFIFETIIISVFASIIGILIVKILVGPLDNILYDLTELNNLIKLNFDKILLVLLIGIVTSVIGSIIPATKASKFDPIKCLK